MVLSELVLLLAGSDDHALAHGKDGANGKDPQRYLDSMRNAKALKANAAQAQDKPLRALDEAADLVEVIVDLAPERRQAVVAALDNDRLADILQELGDDDQAEMLGLLTQSRAADVLEAMDPDDAADLLADLPPDQAETLLQLMEPDEAEDVRRLLSYEERTAGGMMTTEPVILGP